MSKGFLILETGHIFEGKIFGSNTEAFGEVVFNTSMTGYQEIMTDPSYTGQIVTFCYPLIGNYGINQIDNESQKISLAGIVTGEICETPNHYQSVTNVFEQFTKLGLSGIAEVDTRAIVKLIRKHGTIRGLISSEATIPNWDKLTQTSAQLVNQVTTQGITVHENDGPHVVVLDFGVKKSIINSLLEKNCKVTVVPYYFTHEEVAKLNPDGILISNGPGDPKDFEALLGEIRKMSMHYPTLGICLGHQLLALAYGAKTMKLKYGHRGGNHPVKDLQTGKVWITSQNHGYGVMAESIQHTDLKITFKNINDRTVEGLKHSQYPVETVQFHPEAHPGPGDTAHVFDRFVGQLMKTGVKNYATM